MKLRLVDNLETVEFWNVASTAEAYNVIRENDNMLGDFYLIDDNNEVYFFEMDSFTLLGG